MLLPLAWFFVVLQCQTVL